ncbi:hypothetical protein RHSIM_Rhsim05G0113000 [Rhododendron simsii]|uniref:Uncharacterized protein n=1 Tax=Rhododendron simsii TaxID=118357 RepID=A0A834GY99_RHOSS|nr:hypothetical protein RHSIM_Rhsim05G0113000 [Rhododendron simsii]
MMQSRLFSSLKPTVFSSELEPYGEEEELYRCSQFPKHKDDVLAGQMKKAVEKSSDEEMNDEQDEVVTLQGIIRKLTEENLQKDRTISDLREENEEKNRTISELRMWITNHPQSPKPGFGFEGISAQFDKDHLEHENITLQTEIGGMLIDKDIAEEKLEVAADTIDDFLTHTVTQLYRQLQLSLILFILVQMCDNSCTVWTNDVTREVVPLEDIMKLLQGGDVSNWMIDGLARMLTLQLDKDDINHRNVAYFPCTIWKKYVENYMKDRHAELKNQSTGTEVLFEEQNFDAPICSPQNAPQQQNTS